MSLSQKKAETAAKSSKREIEVAAEGLTWAVRVAGAPTRTFASQDRAMQAALDLCGRMFEQGERSVVSLRAETQGLAAVA